MLLSKGQRQLIEKSIKDFEFIKNEITEKVKLNYDLEQIKDFLNRIKGIDICNEIDHYVDFYYNELNLSIYFDEKEIRLLDSIGIYDSSIENYLIENYTLNGVKSLLSKDIYTELIDEIKTYKELKECKANLNVSDKKRNIIKFIEENL